MQKKVSITVLKLILFIENAIEILQKKQGNEEQN